MISLLGAVINSYVFRRAGENSLNWDSADLGYWNGTGFLICGFSHLNINILLT